MTLRSHSSLFLRTSLSSVHLTPVSQVHEEDRVGNKGLGHSSKGKSDIVRHKEKREVIWFVKKYGPGLFYRSPSTETFFEMEVTWDIFNIIYQTVSWNFEVLNSF